MTSSEVLSTVEVAERLGLSTSQVNKLAKSAQLPTMRKFPGARGANLFAAEDVEQFRAERMAS